MSKNAKYGNSAILASTLTAGLWRLIGFLFRCTFPLVAGTAHVFANWAEVRSGHSGHWYNPARSGEGWVLELFEEERAALYWYTYDDERRQRWMISVGSIAQDAEGEYIDFPSLLVTRGGRFGRNFDPGQVEREHVGSAQFRFRDCQSGEFAFEAFGQAMRITVTRLAHLMGSTCESRNGVPWREVSADAGQSGSWYDPARSGEGYTLHWMNPTTPLLTWYSYDSEGNQYWMTGVGHVADDGRLKFPELQATRGARFGEAFVAAEVERFAWGQLSVDLECDGASVEYASVFPNFGDGGMRVQQLTKPVRYGCPYRRPKLTDLYEIEFASLPIDDEIRGFWLRGITDSGVVVLLPGGAGNVVRRHYLEDNRWESLVSPYSPLGISVADARVFSSNDTLLAGQHRWSAASGWQPFEVPSNYQQWFAVDSTPDSSVRIGRGIKSSGGSPSPEDIDTWIWDEGEGFNTLPRLGRDAGFPVCVSSQGSVVGGFVTSTLPTTPPRRTGIAWLNRGEPIMLRDSGGVDLSIVTTCTPGGVIFGADQTIAHPTHPNPRQAWWWKSPEQSGYLGAMDNAALNGFFAYQVMQVAGEGSLAVGFYLAQPPGLISDGFLWTPITGMTSLSTLFNELDISPPWASVPGLSLYARATNSSGTKVLVEATYSDQLGLQTRAAVLTFRPKIPRW